MLVGGPLRGYKWAVRISLQYCFCYFILSTLLMLGLGPFFIGWKNTVGLLLGTSCTSLLIVPTALVANILFARIFRFRTWRNEQWRFWAAGALGVVLTTGGLVLMGFLQAQAPRFLRDFAGESGVLLYPMGWVVLFFNLALLVAWCLPSRKR